MALREVMTLAQAVQIKREVAMAVKKWGLQAQANYTPAQIMQALQVLHEVDDGQAQTMAAEQAKEITKLKRQLAVCLNREKLALKRTEKATKQVVNLQKAVRVIADVGEDHVVDEEEVT